MFEVKFQGRSKWIAKSVFVVGHGTTGGKLEAATLIKYSVDWTPEKFDFKVDGRLIYRVTKPMVEHYGKWAFDDPKFLILNLALGGAYPYKTNGVEEPYNGIPASTVELIKEGKAEVLIDWVLITD